MGILLEEKWETTLFYLATLTIVFIVGSFDGEERGGDENEYLEKMIPSPFQLLKSKTGDVSLLYKFFHINLTLMYKNLK